jgi:hypothetical protein
MADTASTPIHQALPYGMNIRLTQDQRVFLQLVAEANDEKVSAALRRVVDEAIALVVEDNRAPDGTRRDPFGIVSSWQPDPAWLERHSEDDS